MQSSVLYFDAPGVKVNIIQTISFWNQCLWSLFHCCSKFSCRPFESTFSTEWCSLPLLEYGDLFPRGMHYDLGQNPSRLLGNSAQELPCCSIFLMTVYLMSPNRVQWPFYYFVLQFSGKLCKWCRSLLPFLFSLPPPHPRTRAISSWGWLLLYF